MAVKGEVTANVGINVDDKNLNKVIQGLDALAAKAIKTIEGVGAAANKQRGRVVSEKELNEINGYVKALAGITKGINTLKQALPSNLNVNRALGVDGNDQALAKRGIALAKYRQELNETLGVTEKFRTRINQLDREAANGLRQGQAPDINLVRRREQLTETLKAYEQFSAKQAQIMARSSLLSPDSAKQLNPLILKLQELKQVFNDLAGDGRRTNFKFLTESMQQITLEMDKQVNNLRIQEGLEARLSQRAKERAAGVLGISSRQESINRERAAKSELGRLTSTQTDLGDRLGSAGLQNRLARATEAYKIAKDKLQAAIARDAAGPELDRLIARYQLLDKVIIETIALQGRAANQAQATAQAEVRASQKRIAAQQVILEALQKEEDKASSKKLKTNNNQSDFAKGLRGIAESGGAIGLVTRVGAYAVAATAIFGVINALKEGARFTINFEDKLATLAAISNSTSEQMRGLSKSILEVGANSKFSVLELTDAATQLAQAGVGTKAIEQSLSSVSGLAAASGSTIAQSVDVITAALGSFQLNADQTVHIADALVSGLNRTRLTIKQVGLAIQYAGATAYENNVSFEQLIASVSTLSQAGVKSGSTAGTGIRQFLVDLQTPSEKLTEQLKRLGLTAADVDVKVRGLPAVIKTLGDAGFGSAQAFQGLELRAAAAFLILKNNQGLTEGLTQSLYTQGTAAAANEKAMGSLSAQTQRFFNILAKKSGGGQDFTDFLGNLLKGINDLSEAENESEEKIKNSIRSLNDQADALALNGQAFEASLKRYQANTIELDNFGTINTVTSSNVKDLTTALNQASEEFDNQQTTVTGLQTELERVLTQYDATTITSGQLQTEVIALGGRFEGLTANIGNTTSSLGGLISALQQTQVQAANTLATLAQVAGRTASEQFRTTTDKINGNLKGNILNNTQLSLLSKANQAGVRDFFLKPNPKTGKIDGFNTNGIADALKELDRLPGGQGSGLRSQLNDLLQTAATRSSAFQSFRTYGSAERGARFNASPEGSTLNNQIAVINARQKKLQSQLAGKTPSERSSLTSSLLKDTQGLLSSVTAKAGDKSISSADRSQYADRARELQSTLTALTGATTPSSKEGKATAAAARRAASAGRSAAADSRRQGAQDRRNSGQTSGSGLKASSRNLDSILGTSTDIGSDFDKLPEFVQKTNDALGDWVKSRKDVLAAAIAAPGLSDDQIKDLTDDAETEIRAKQRDVFSKLADSSTEVLTTFIERANRRIEAEYNSNLIDSQLGISKASGTLSGLNNPLVAQRIPESSRVIAQRKIDLANDAYRIQNLSSTTTKKTSKEAEIDQAYISLANARTKLAASEYGGNPDQIRAANKAVQDQSDAVVQLQTEIDTLNNSLAVMNAEQDAISAKPLTFSEGINQAVEAFKIKNDVGSSLQSKLIGGLDGVLEESSQAFQGFFTSIVTGTSSVGDAFGNMASAVIDAIAAMAAKAVATQIFGLLLSFIPGFGGLGPAQNLTAFDSLNLVGTPVFRGGYINPVGNVERYARGGIVGSGVSTRDSVPSLLSKGEFVIRNSSVESIGRDLLQDMNNRGASALNKMNNGSVIMPQSQLQSNVYVVLPEEKPQLGPNDVLAVISRDVLRGGQTKALIKQVAAGG